MRKPIRSVRFTEALFRDAKIRDQNPSLNNICPGEPHQRHPNAPKFEDRSQEETEWQEQGAREAAWKQAKKTSKLKEKKRATFFSLTEKWCPLHHPKLNLRREFVAAGASMHMTSMKDVNSAEMETVKVSRIPILVVTAHGEVQTHEESTVYVKELDKFLTVKVLEDTPAVLSLGKLCEDHGYSNEWIVVKNHVSSKKVRGYNAIRKTTSQSWSQGYRRLLLRQARLVEHLQHQYRRKVLGQNLFQHQLDVRVQMTKDDRQIPKPKFYLEHDQEGGDLCHSDIPEWLQ